MKGLTTAIAVAGLDPPRGSQEEAVATIRLPAPPVCCRLAKGPAPPACCVNKDRGFVEA